MRLFQKPSEGVSLIGKTNGQASSEHRFTWLAMAASFLAIAGQVLGELWLGRDLGVNIDLALGTAFGSGAAYTIARGVVKYGIAAAEGKVKSTPKLEEPEPKTVLPPVRGLESAEAEGLTETNRWE